MGACGCGLRVEVIESLNAERPAVHYIPWLDARMKSCFIAEPSCPDIADTTADEKRKIFSVDPVPKPFHFFAAFVATKRAAKDDFAVTDIPEQLPWRLSRSSLPIKRTRLVSAMRTGISGDVAATVLVRTNGLGLAWAAMPAFRGVAEGGHGFVTHSCVLMLYAALYLTRTR